MNVQTPYINTHLYTTIGLHPSQFDNDIYKHLKNNLIKKLQGRCYKNYGYISKIYKIDERHGGEIVAENPSASALYNIKFSCKICRPLRGTIIICEVVTINKSLIHLRNGPINILMFEDSGTINQNNFIFDDKKNVLIAKNGGNQIPIPVVTGTFVEVKVSASRIEQNSNRILITGTLENIASKKAIEESIRQRETDDLNFTNFNVYTESENQFYSRDELIAEDVAESSSESELDSDSGDSSVESD